MLLCHLRQLISSWYYQKIAKCSRISQGDSQGHRGWNNSWTYINNWTVGQLLTLGISGKLPSLCPCYFLRTAITSQFIELIAVTRTSLESDSVGDDNVEFDLKYNNANSSFSFFFMHAILNNVVLNYQNFFNVM